MGKMKFGHQGRPKVTRSLLVLGILLIQSMTQVVGQTTPTAPAIAPTAPAIAPTAPAIAPTVPGPATNSTGEDGLLKYYELLYEQFEKIPAAEASDCNLKNTSDSHKLDALDHHNWGTVHSLKFLSGNENHKMHGEALQDLAKLRVFLARVGYLKVPGSLILRNKQTETLSLAGCNDDAIWKMQGEKDIDKDFRQTGNRLKTQAPNSANYIHKFTCLSLKKPRCSHTFYVITRPLPEMPPGFQIRENTKMEKDDYSFTCAVPFCNINKCKVSGGETSRNKRSYPPYSITWSVKSRANPAKDEIKTGKDQQALNLTEGSIDKKESKLSIEWGHKIRTGMDAEENKKDSYKDVKEENWIDAFGDKVPDEDREQAHFHSRILIHGADFEKHNGPYECILQDGNGVVSTPSVIKKGYKDWVTFKGKTNIHVMSSIGLYVFFGVAFGSIVLVFLLILICPKKMEYDDGTAYTKEELVSPESDSAEKAKSE